MSCRTTIKAEWHGEEWRGPSAGGTVKNRFYMVPYGLGGGESFTKWRVSGSTIELEEEFGSIDLSAWEIDGFAVDGGTPDPDNFFLLTVDYTDPDYDISIYRLNSNGDVQDSRLFGTYELGRGVLSYNGYTDRLLVCLTSLNFDTGVWWSQVHVLDPSTLNTLDSWTFEGERLFGRNFITTKDGYSWLYGSEVGFHVFDSASLSHEFYEVPSELAPASPDLTKLGLDCTGYNVEFVLEGGS